MAIGFGAGSDMHKAVNRQKGDRKKSKRSLQESSEMTSGTGGSALKFKNQATPEMLAEIKAKKQAENRRNLIVVLSSILIVGIIIVLAVAYL